MAETEDQLKQLQNLIEIDKMLCSPFHHPTIEEIADRLCVNTRTVGRYIARMRSIFSAPIVSFREGNKYVYKYSDDTFSLTDISINQNEANALIFARELLQSIPLTEFYDGAVKGLNSLILRAKHFKFDDNHFLQDKIIFTTDVAKAAKRSDLKALEQVLCEAFEKNLPVRFAIDETGEDIPPREEVFYPLFLTSFHGSWYILVVKNALGLSEKMNYKLPERLTEHDFELIDFYQISSAKIIALFKERSNPELIARHENSSSYAPAASIIYNDSGLPVLSFTFWFLGYSINLGYFYNTESGKMELVNPIAPLKMVYKEGEEWI